MGDYWREHREHRRSVRMVRCECCDRNMLPTEHICTNCETEQTWAFNERVEAERCAREGEDAD